MPDPHNCLDCIRATWKRAADGKRLHPDGTGKCVWKMPEIVLPAAFYYLGSRDIPPAPLGGFINRKRPYEDCPAWEGRGE